jgi:Transmembrane domain of unknown function (DUF3566)
VNDTTRTPDEPDRPVVPDDQVRDTADRAGNGTKPRKTPRSGTAGGEVGGSAADGASRQAADPPAAGAADAARASGSAGSARGSAAKGAAEPSARAADQPTVETVDPAAMTTPAMSLRPAQEPAVEPSAAKPSDGPSAQRSTSSTAGARKAAARQEAGTPASGLPRSTPSFVKADDEPTTRMRFPATANGASPATDQKTQPVPQQGTTAAAVPMPGPAADAPPPWDRVPGQEPSPVLVENRPTEAAVDEVEGPTAFLDPPAPPRPDERKPGRPSGTAPPSRGGRARPPRQASLQLKRLDPWSVLKLALVLAVVLFLIWLVAVGVLYGVLDGIGVWDRLNGTYADLVSGEAPSGSPLISAGRVFGIAAVVGAVNSLLFAVAVTVGAFVYNVSADLVGGIEVTLSERD